MLVIQLGIGSFALNQFVTSSFVAVTDPVERSRSNALSGEGLGLVVSGVVVTVVGVR